VVGRALGMVISRRPNRWESSEKAPGPRNAAAREVTIINAFASLALNKFQGGGNHESKMPRLPRLTKRLAAGLKNPIRRDEPLRINRAAANHAPACPLQLCNRYRTP